MEKLEEELSKSFLRFFSHLRLNKLRIQSFWIEEIHIEGNYYCVLCAAYDKILSFKEKLILLEYRKRDENKRNTTNCGLIQSNCKRTIPRINQTLKRKREPREDIVLRVKINDPPVF